MMGLWRKLSIFFRFFSPILSIDTIYFFFNYIAESPIIKRYAFFSRI